MTRSRHVRCRWCGTILPAWLPIPHKPESAMRLHHLSAWHLAEAQPSLVRMAVEDIETVVMELFEHLPCGEGSGRERDALLRNLSR